MHTGREQRFNVVQWIDQKVNIEEVNREKAPSRCWLTEKVQAQALKHSDTDDLERVHESSILATICKEQIIKYWESADLFILVEERQNQPGMQERSTNHENKP